MFIVCFVYLFVDEFFCSENEQPQTNDNEDELLDGYRGDNEPFDEPASNANNQDITLCFSCSLLKG